MSAVICYASNMTDTEEDHTYWLEKQLRLIELIGLQNYLVADVKPDE